MSKIKKHYYRQAKKMSDSTLNVIHSICNSATFESMSLGIDNIPINKSADCVLVSKHLLLTKNIDSSNYQLHGNLENAEQVHNNYSDSSECDIIENESISHNNFDNDVINIVNVPAFDNLVDENNVINNVVNVPASNNLVDDNDGINNVVNVPAFDNLIDDYNFVLWLQNWAIKNHISHIALNELMTALKCKYPELPSDSRTLLKTPRKITVQDVKPGQYYHFGVTNCVKQLVLRYPVQHLQCVQVNINIDGLPLFKSTSAQVYPILCNLVGNYNEVNIIGIYYGTDKPENANIYLRDFVEEVIALTTHGIIINGDQASGTL